MQQVKSSCGCVGILQEGNFIPTTFNCSQHKIGAKYVFSLHIRKQRTTVGARNIKPHLEELIHRCGGTRQAADYSGLTDGTVQRIMRDHYKTVQMKTARRIMDSLIEKREEDRRRYGVDKKLINNVKKRAIKDDRIQSDYEERLERLTGY